MAGTPTRFSPEGDIDAFLKKAARTPRPGGGGRLIFALDATASREPTWDRASHLQAEMFQTAAALGGLEVQLVFYRGFRECKASGWVRNANDLLKRMLQIRCYGGLTQIGRVLAHAAKETNKRKVDALVFVGDAFEEDIDRVSHEAGQLGMLGTPAFLFQEGGDPLATRGFNEIARLTGGACCRFDTGSAEQLRALLRAVAAFAAGGRAALTSLPGSAAKQLAGQMKAPAGRREEPAAVIGVVVLVLALLVCLPLLARWAANADPRVLLRVLRLAAVLVMGAAVLLLLVFGRGLVLGLLAPLLFGLFMQWRRARNMAKTARGPTPGKGSEVQTRFLSMRLDHDSGAMHGRVIDGPHTGASLSDLAENQLFDLLRFYTGNDPRSAQLLESWLDREGPESWRDRAAHEAPAAGGAGMSRNEAYKVLGLAPGAAAAEIRAAHRRLMREYHPDRGGSTFFAAQINQAKDILLGS